MSDYFYILTISWTTGHAMEIRTRSGLATDVPHDQNQEDLYTLLFNNTCDHFGAPRERTSVTFYHLVRNRPEPTL